ncbi:MAG TPA: tRNA threonylcarbamoyladenosine dehydratase [Candidatus Faecenecus gallistercoris]|uniref:tRNA threonylcarbamoyladenosine dehydratase n=1 Tax=Candidatus Faecenecus gallistercoris TaxID=2840793 RepID=A0A9D0YYQ0_9FIRM|nr:tRNA threonylcarbamoyladenosine dehydratase [Candidatus Faecenecus gallistercoris]
MSEFSRVSMLIDINQLKNKTVAIVGIGGVGGYVAESLARSGVGKLILVDYDVVDETNINRQIIALHSTIGKKKVSLMEERIHDICEDTQVVSYRIMYGEENRYDIFSEKIDFLVDACDIVRSKQILITECLNRGIPFISSMGTGNRLDPSKLTITDLAKTEGDPLARIMRKWAKDRGIRTPIPVLYSSELPIKTGTRQPGSLIFVPASAGLLIGSYIVRYFLSN